MCLELYQNGRSGLQPRAPAGGARAHLLANVMRLRCPPDPSGRSSNGWR